MAVVGANISVPTSKSLMAGMNALSPADFRLAARDGWRRAAMVGAAPWRVVARAMVRWMVQPAVIVMVAAVPMVAR